MDIQIDGNYKYYKCRSLLTCDTGGTVYETFKEFEDFGNNVSLLKSKDQNLNESHRNDNICIVDMESEYKKEKKSLVDLTTHLDDDEFNDYEMHLNVNCKPENEVAQNVPRNENIKCLNLRESGCVKNKDLICFSSEKDDGQIVQNLVDEIIEDEDIFVVQNLENYQDMTNLSNSTNFKDVHDSIRKYSSLSDGSVHDQKEINFQYFLTSFGNNSDISDLNSFTKQETSEYEYDSSTKIRVISTKKHIHKRKQTYNIKYDSCTELLNEDKDVFNKTIFSSVRNKKKKSRCNKENQRKKLQYHKRNPFANLKMNSILKGNKLTINRNRNYFKLQNRESISSNDESFGSSNNNYNDEYFGQNNYIFNDENFGRSNINFFDEDAMIYKKRSYQSDYFTSFHSKTDVLQEIGAIIKLNSEFSNADYLEYVQPRERIIESDMDKLLSPTIDIEFSEIFKTCALTKLIKDKQEQVDCNGNELNFHDIKKINKNKSILSPYEIAERELFLKSAYAKKLGYENYFNTSNESIINEILFDPSITYEEIKLDLNFLKQIQMYSKQNEVLDKSFKSVSCTLLESINEFNRFGGFVEEICDEKESNYAEENSNVSIDKIDNSSEVNKFQKENNNLNLKQDLSERDHNQVNSNFTFNFSNKSNLLSLDFQSRYNSLDCLKNTSKPSSNSLKIKIKRINDENNEYIIDDSIGHFIDINKKTISKSIKNIYRYKCYNCSAKFRTKRILKNHVSESHRGPYDTECEICHMKFKKSSAHKKHQPWCQKNVTHKCDTCSKVYCYRASLIKHLKSHKKVIN